MTKTLLLAFALATAAVAAPYRNPVIPYNPAEHEIADPYVLKWNGEYYLYASGDPIQAWHSTDLVHWDKLGAVLQSTPGSWNEADVWAPEVVYRNGKFLMYYTASRKSADWRVNEMARRVGVAVSDSPRGPFRDVGHPAIPNWAIDGDVVHDPVGDQDWIFYSSLQEPRYPGAAIAQDKLVRFDRSQGKPLVAIAGSEAWEDKDGDPANGSLRYTNEGPTVVMHGGKYYCLYSGGSWDQPTYAVSYAVADKITGPWRKAQAPILRATPLVDGPGHDAVCKAPNNLDDVHFYHARVQPYTDPWNRVPFADRLFWNGDRPWTSQPSLGYLPSPSMPAFRELFDGDLSGWKVDGDFAVADGVARAIFGTLESNRPLPPESVLEANVRLTAPDSRAGVRLGGRELVFDAARRATLWGGKTIWKWPAGYRPEAFHQLLLTRRTGQVELEVDGVPRGRFDLQGDGWGLAALAGGCEWDGIALTAGLQESFRSGTMDWEMQQGRWTHAEGSLRGSGLGSSAAAVALRPSSADAYEFSSTLLPDDTANPLVERPGPRDKKWVAGIVAGSAGPWQVTAGYDKAIWPLARFQVAISENGSERHRIEVPMPRGFRYGVAHTVRVVRQGAAWTFFLDGKETLDTVFAMEPSQAGLFASGVDCSFTECSWAQLGGDRNWLLDGGFESEQFDNSQPAFESVWSFSGSARVNESQPHTGLRRLLFAGAVGEARQTVQVPAGRYRLHAFAQGDGTLRLASGAQSSATPVTATWQPVQLDFDSQGTSVITLAATPGQALVVDDLYLERL